MALTVSSLARKCSLSRSTILYYESQGLLKSSGRSIANYRIYSNADLIRLRQICVYRAAGLKLADIRVLLDERRNNNAAGVLKRRLLEISREIETLREHQLAIARLLKDTDQFRRIPMVTKQKWVEVMRAAGFTEADMQRWHAQFEQSAPEEHQEFLDFLHIPADEVRAIREASRRKV